MKILNKFRIFAEETAEKSAIFALFLFFILAILALIDAFLRRSGSSINGFHEWVEIIIMLSISAIMPIVMWRKQALSIQILGQILKKEALLDLLGAGVLFLFLLICSGQMAIYVGEVWHHQEILPALKIPKYLLWGSAFLFWAFATFIQALVFLEQLGKLK